MPDTLTLEAFLPHLHEVFLVRLKDIEPIPLELVEAALLPGAASPPGARRSFSLTFLGPISQQYLRQATYPLEHTQMGALDLFIVPLGLQAGRMQYQAIFN